jgi:hypothetical protein
MMHHIGHQAHTPALHERKVRLTEIVVQACYCSIAVSEYCIAEGSTFFLSFLTYRSTLKGRLQLVNLCLVSLQLDQVIVPILEESIGAATSN